MSIMNNVKKVLQVYLQNYNDAPTIFLVGSNHNKKEFNNIQSDIDIIVLSKLKTQQLIWDFEDITYDVIILNENDILKLSCLATNGNYIFSKILSAMANYTIIKSEHEMTNKFISLIGKLNNINQFSYVPNYYLISSYKHNIIVNYNDYKVKVGFENFFSEQRLLNQLFGYISYIVYPYYIQGSFQGKILEPYLNKYISSGSAVKIDVNSIQILIEKYSPHSKHIYLAFEFNIETKKIIEDKVIEKFFFGYSDLFTEKIIVFISKSEMIKIPSYIKSKSLQIVNDILGFDDDDHHIYYNLLNQISRDFYYKSSNECLSFLNQIFSIFTTNDAGDYIKTTLKRIILEKTADNLLKSEKSVSIDAFIVWLDKVSFEPPYIEFMVETKKSEIVKNLLIKNWEIISTRERIIKSVSLYLGIMKALRIKIEELNL